MQTLYPIIRRVRRPLVVTESEPVQPLATQPKVEGGAQGTARPTEVDEGDGKTSDEKTSRKKKAR